MERAVVHEPHHLEDGEQVPFAFFEFRALIPMAAVFDVQWMQMISLCKLVQFRTRGVGDVMPLHTLRIALVVAQRDHRVGSGGMPLLRAAPLFRYRFMEGLPAARPP
jgi:hypothetical protein